MARYLPKAKLLIQHVPRCGGTWVENALELIKVDFDRWLNYQPGYLPRKHALLAHYYPHKMANVRRVAAFVRQPFDWYQSVWRFLWSARSSGRRTLATRWPWHPKKRAAELWHPDFDRWAVNMIENDPGWYTRLLEGYVGPPGGEYCHFVGRVETLQADFISLMKRMKYGQELSRVDLDSLGCVNERPVPSQPETPKSIKGRINYAERVVLERFYDENRNRRWYASLA